MISTRTFVLAATLILAAWTTTAQGPSATQRPEELSLTQQGQLFTVQLIPGSRQLTVSVTGKPMAEVDPRALKVFGRTVVEGRRQNLRIESSGTQYRILDPVTDKPVEIEVQDPKTKRSETFRFEARPMD